MLPVGRAFKVALPDALVLAVTPEIVTLAPLTALLCWSTTVIIIVEPWVRKVMSLLATLWLAASTPRTTKWKVVPLAKTLASSASVCWVTMALSVAVKRY